MYRRRKGAPIFFVAVLRYLSTVLDCAQANFWGKLCIGDIAQKIRGIFSDVILEKREKY